MFKTTILCSLLVNQAFGASITLADGDYYKKDQLESEGESLESVASKVHFYLYTKENDNAYEIVVNDSETLRNSTFKRSRPTKIAIHGYEHDYNTEACQLIKKVYLESTQDLNIICVEWSKLCLGPPFGIYIEAVQNVPKVGKLLANLIDFLVTDGSANISSFHLIGHSLGAHLAAFAANMVTSGNITRISGLDPANPLYNYYPDSERLDSSDADFVDVIHTSGGYYGLYKPLGTVDFYPNGGKPKQPGCQSDITFLFLVSCSHQAVVRYYASSVLNTFQAKLCSSFDEMKMARCNGTVGYMGDLADLTPSGIYYLQTSSSWPYTLDVGVFGSSSL